MEKVLYCMGCEHCYCTDVNGVSCEITKETSELRRIKPEECKYYTPNMEPYCDHYEDCDDCPKRRRV